MQRPNDNDLIIYAKIKMLSWRLLLKLITMDEIIAGQILGGRWNRGTISLSGCVDIIRRAHEHPKGVVKRYLVAIVNTGTMRDTLKPKRKRRVETADLFQVIREDAI